MYEIEWVTLPERHALVGRATVSPEAISATLAELFGAVMGHLTILGKQPCGFPFTRYLEMGEKRLRIEAGMLVAEALAGENGVHSVVLPSCKAAKTIHRGLYDTLNLAHDAVRAWIAAQGFRENGQVLEVYVTDPGCVPDPKDWQTEVYLGVISEEGRHA